ncbi:short-chain dehydrogenase/ reductase-like protein [Pleomassaria siparia CBS 279.74]|uniref:Short-chain dehydrogenase/ reductase-like protein n=1 Tax=Pleomassaria siparia CBS 279.74 TaxID=1314801 RepID=A0A6G1JSU0_9PLEO|nr:short-chain dehydrogenase/ reductase-like protein [Pleomassaria siparia CBS 279.74]
MPAIQGHVNFNPDKDIPSLEGKVIFVTGGTAGIGASTVQLLAVHNPSHIYFSGRNAKASDALIASIHATHPKVGLTFVPMDLTSLSSVKTALTTHFTHTRLDILVCNAGIMAQQTKLSADGYEIQFAVNHLGNAMVTTYLLPTMLATAKTSGSDVRIVNLTSLGYGLHPGDGILFDELDAHSVQNRFFMGPWMRYGQSKLANILYAAELARRHPEVTAVSVHPGVVNTDLVYTQTFINRTFIRITNVFMGEKALEPEQGAWNPVWCAAAAKKEDLKNGGFYVPVGLESSDDLKKDKLAGGAESVALAKKLWEWTDGILAKV